MGIKLDSCSCFKNSEDIAIEVELNSDRKRKIQILTQQNIVPLHKKELMKSYSIFEEELSKILSNNNNDSANSEKCDLEPLINNIKTPELLIQSIFKGYLFRKKFNEIDGLKLELIEKYNEEIKNIVISKITLKGEK